MSNPTNRTAGNYDQGGMVDELEGVAIRRGLSLVAFLQIAPTGAGSLGCISGHVLDCLGATAAQRQELLDRLNRELARWCIEMGLGDTPMQG